MPEEPRLLAGRYELRDELGRGGMAVVYRGIDRVLGRSIALKVLSPAYAHDDAFVTRFRREARAAAGLIHPNVVAVFDTGSDEGTHFIVMEFLEGRTLADVIDQDGPLSGDRAAEIAARVCDALEFAHERGIVHRDIKPANVMVTPEGAVKVMDFGIARAATDDTLTRTAVVLGTANYLSPEQAEGRPVDARSDLYSLGVVLYEALTGRPPFTGTTPVAVAAKHVDETPVAPRNVRPEVQPALNAVVMRALEKDPARRFASATEMRGALEHARAGERTDPVPASSTAVLLQQPRSIRRARRWPILAAVATVIVLTAILAAIAAGGSSPNDLAKHRSPTAPPATRSNPSPVETSPADTAPTLDEAVDALYGLIEEGEASGALEKHAADDLTHHLDEVVKKLEEGKGEDIDKKLSELQDKVPELAEKGEIEEPYTSRIAQAVDVLAAAIGAGGDGEED